MACTIAISPPTGQEASPGQGVISLTVSGTATDCSAVRVRVQQTTPVNAATPQKTVSVTGGQWSVDFSVNAGDFALGTLVCGRGNKYAIEAECVDDSTCSEVLTSDLISCGDCPDVDITVTPGDCVDGRRTVHLKADVVSPADATYTWLFGTDEDNQPGEDSQSGDGSGNPWLPAPVSGVRTVEADHIYEPAGDQPQVVTVTFVTSTGPNSECVADRQFTLEPCDCELKVSLEVLDSQGTQVPTDECLEPGSYVAAVTDPTGSDVGYAWSVDGSADDGQDDATFDFSIADGEEKTISVVVDLGGCSSSNGVTIRGCEDCSDFETQLQILDDRRTDVTDEDCLPPGDYTVRATSPTGAGITYRWSVDNEVDETATSSTLLVTLGVEDEQIVTLEASQGGCRDTTTVAIRTCPPEPEEEDEDADDGFIPCLLFKLLALLGLGLVFLGAILLLCPAVAAPFPASVAVFIGIGLLAGGAVLLALGLLLWTLICEPTGCDWLAFLWQALVLLGLLMIYAGFCPACSWMLLGGVPLILGVGTSVFWGRNCNPSRCRVLSEWISLFTFVVNVVAILEIILAACVVTSRPIASAIWGLVIAGFQGWLWFEANRSNCIRG